MGVPGIPPVPADSAPHRARPQGPGHAARPTALPALPARRAARAARPIALPAWPPVTMPDPWAAPPLPTPALAYSLFTSTTCSTA